MLYIKVYETKLRCIDLFLIKKAKKCLIYIHQSLQFNRNSVSYTFHKRINF